MRLPPFVPERSFGGILMTCLRRSPASFPRPSQRPQAYASPWTGTRKYTALWRALSLCRTFVVNPLLLFDRAAFHCVRLERCQSAAKRTNLVGPLGDRYAHVEFARSQFYHRSLHRPERTDHPSQSIDMPPLSARYLPLSDAAVLSEDALEAAISSSRKSSLTIVRFSVHSMHVCQVGGRPDARAAAR